MTNGVNDRFRVVAAAVERVTRSTVGDLLTPSLSPSGGEGVRRSGQEALPATGAVEVQDKLVRFIRPGLVEEYSVSLDGVRQDFVVTEKPPGTGALQVRLDVAGARVEFAAAGAHGSGGRRSRGFGVPASAGKPSESAAHPAIARGTG